MLTKDFHREAIELLISEARFEHSYAHSHARLLLDGITGIRFSHLVAPEVPLEPSQIEKLRLWLEEVKRGRPIPYILNKAAFFALEFEVDERVLIPRPETELLVETALERLKTRPAPKIVDLGTGSGAIAISIAKNLQGAQVYALDISAGALEVATRNAAKNNAQIEFIQGNGDWLNPIREFAPFDAILSNPPYIAKKDIEELEIGVREFEPRLALDGGDDGLNPYRELTNAKPLLKGGGFLAVELGMGQFADIKALFEKSGWAVEEAKRDLAGIERVLVAHPLRSED